MASSTMSSIFVFVLLVTIACQSVSSAVQGCTNGNIKCGGNRGSGGSDCVFGTKSTLPCKCSGGLEANCNFRESKCYCS